MLSYGAYCAIMDQMRRYKLVSSGDVEFGESVNSFFNKNPPNVVRKKYRDAFTRSFSKWSMPVVLLANVKGHLLDIPLFFGREKVISNYRLAFTICLSFVCFQTIDIAVRDVSLRNSDSYFDYGSEKSINFASSILKWMILLESEEAAKETKQPLIYSELIDMNEIASSRGWEGERSVDFACNTFNYYLRDWCRAKIGKIELDEITFQSIYDESRELWTALIVNLDLA